MYHQWTVDDNWVNRRREGCPPVAAHALQDFYFSYFDFEFCVSNGLKKKSCVCSRYLEMENISAHGPKKYTCQKKHNSATCTWFCFNKFTFSLETHLLRKTTFVTFSVLGIVYQTLKALSLWQQEPPWQKGEEVWESREVSLWVLCFHFVDPRLLNDLFVAFVQFEIWPN